MTEKRIVILVPTEQDMTSPEYMATYWPNFVCAVEMALAQAKIDCRLVVSSHIDAATRQTAHSVTNRWPR